MKHSRNDAEVFGWEGLKGWAYNTKEEFPPASAAYFEVTGRHGRVKSIKSDRVYLILEGVGEFNLNGDKSIVREGDVIIVPKNMPYDYRAMKGLLKLFLVHSPAFDPDAEKKLD